jgi:predicted nucleotidyltransferase component of viral defense system
MLKISEQELKQEAKNKGYRSEMLEKVYHLLDLLEEFMAVPYLSDRLVLKGGTAINLFCTEQFPRLSIDIDLNYIGAVDKETMQQEKLVLENIMQDIFRRRKYALHRNPRNHAGGKTVLTYSSIMGTKGRLEIDLNYLYRIPLWDPKWRTSPNWPKATRVKVLDIHELAAGKLNALLERDASRDLFDSYQLLTQWPLEAEKLRLAFTVYAAMRKQNWQQIKIDNVEFSVKDIRDKLFPVLKASETPDTLSSSIHNWAENLVDKCKAGLSIILPFRDNEIEFLERLQRYGEIQPELICKDSALCERINSHPLLRWRRQQLDRV